MSRSRPGAGVADVKRCGASLGIGLQLNIHVAFLRELQRIANQVDQHLAQPCLIRSNRAKSPGDHHLKHHPRPGASVFQLEDCLLHQRTQIHWLALYGEIAVLDPGQINHVIDEGQKVKGVLPDSLQMLAIGAYETGSGGS